MNYRIAVCDDIQSDRDVVSAIVTEWARKTENSVDIREFSSAEEFLFRFEDDNAYDILLLDIEMKEISGVEMAKRVRSVNKEVQIVFITGYNDYIAEGYDVEALHYILKPVREDKLCEILDRACERIRKNEQVLILELSDSAVRVPLYTVRFIEVRQNYVTVHADDEITVKLTLSAIEQRLDDSFFRIGRSYIVNLRFIRKIAKKEVYLSTGETIPLPRGSYEALNRAFINYYGGK